MKASKALSFRISKNTLRDVREQCSVIGLPVSAYCRMAVLHLLKEQRVKKLETGVDK